jgi:hypothetical protein
VSDEFTGSEVDEIIVESDDTDQYEDECDEDFCDFEARRYSKISNFSAPPTNTKQ